MPSLLKINLALILLLQSNFLLAEQIKLEKSTLGEFAQVVSDYLDKPVIVAYDLKMPFSINAKFDDKAHLKELFKTSILASGLSYDETDSSIVVSALIPKKELDKPEVIKTVVSYRFKNSSASDSFQLLKTAFSDVVIVDAAANNSLLITATEQEHKNITKLVAGLDFPVKQVLIEAVISELSDNDYQGLDAKLENYRRLDAAVDAVTPYAVANPLSSLANFGMKLLTSKSLRFFLDWIETVDSSAVLSKPKIVTLDRKQASIIVGQNVPFITGKSTSQASSTSTPFQTIERHDIGLKLQVTPVILPNGVVQLSILQESSSVDANTLASDIVTNKRSVTSTALIKDGDTLLLGGLSSNSSSGGHTSTMPGDIPVLNWFFSGDKKSKTNTNLVVLITAKIINSSLPILAVD